MADAALKNRIVGHGEEAPEQLLANPRNWRIHPHLQEEALEGALAQVGWVQTVLVNRTTGHLIDGHLRVALAIRLGEPSLPVTYVELTEEEESLVLASLDPLAGMAGLDEEAFAALLGEVTVDSAALREMLAGVGTDGKRSVSEEDDIPEVPAEPTTKPGDLWLLGDHRLLCGDATEPTSWGRLMDGTHAADMIWTDPPYGVAIASRIGTSGVANTEARKLGKRQIQGDAENPDAVRELLVAVLSLALEWVDSGGGVYIAAPSGPPMAAFVEALLALGDIWKQSLVWVKDSLVLGRTDYHYRHEMVFYGWKAGGRHTFRGGRSQDTVWEISRPKRSEDHPTMKPIELVARALENSSRTGALVLDPFLGSGTTVIAAEQTGRRCYAMDIDPHYCDVAVKRWENFTGKTAELAERPDTGQGGTRHGQPRAAAERAGTRSRTPRP